MEIFDWKWFQPRNDEDDGQFEPYELATRYRRSLALRAESNPELGDYYSRVNALWSRLIEDLGNAPEDDVSAVEDLFFDEADALFGHRQEIRARGPGVEIRPCVFISHQRADAHRGERVACLADHRGVDAWIDIHDPILKWLNGHSVSPAVRSLLIAAIVEVALLASTHVLALHTSNSLASKWVPYELARAKARRFASRQAAGWFEGRRPLSAYPPIHGDYVQLAVMLASDQAVYDWLPAPPTSPWPAGPCGQHNTTELA